MPRVKGSIDAAVGRAAASRMRASRWICCTTLIASINSDGETMMTLAPHTSARWWRMPSVATAPMTATPQAPAASTSPAAVTRSPMTTPSTGDRMDWRATRAPGGRNPSSISPRRPGDAFASSVPPCC